MHDPIICQIDNEPVHYLPAHLAEKHNITVEEYLAKYPDAPLESEYLQQQYTTLLQQIKRKQAPNPEDLTITVGEVPFPVNYDVPEEACLPLPEYYRLPTHGQLGLDVKRVIRYFAAGRSQWIWGPTGCGKDALPSALCAWTRTPSMLFPINPDTDIMAWFFDKTFQDGKICWEFGELFNALVHGYKSPTSGRTIPMTIVLSDFDRASRAQAEALRLIGDSIQGRIKGPKGETYRVLKGTRIICTANTMGAGDVTGKSVSANVLDTSIINRIERKVRFHFLDWEDEEPVIREKFPLVAKHFGHKLKAIGQATLALRTAVENEDLYGEFSHRDLCTWIGDMEDMILHNDKFEDTDLPHDIFQQAFASYSDGLPDAENKALAESIVDPYIRGGMLPRGDTKGVREKDLHL